MPRKSRIDAPGALHHITARGIERCLIFRNDADRDNFIERLATILVETKTRCLAWALMNNHFHLLLKTGKAPVATVMRRVMTGHAVSFNRRYRRHGHLFQNRYKSILCQEDAYLAELVRYIHLNPVRARLVPDMDALDRYPYAGHSVLVGHAKRDWQDTQAVLGRFGKTIRVARRHYRQFVKAGIEQGRRSDLTGGGLIRSAGGWGEVKALRKAMIFEKSDERILGDGGFVEEVLASAREQMERKSLLKARGIDLGTVAARVSAVLEVDAGQLERPGKERRRVSARSLYCFWAVRELGLSLSELSRKFGLSLTGVSQSVKRGEKLAEEKNVQLLEELKIKLPENRTKRSIV
jgi:REP element-mobilizing transposase RayT